MFKKIHTEDAKEETHYARMQYKKAGFPVTKFGNKNCFLVSFDKNDGLFFSYKTPVAATIRGNLFVTEEKYSTTTSRHISHYIKHCGYPKVNEMPEAFFEALLEALGD